MTDTPPPLAQAITDGLNAHHEHMREAHAEHRKAEKLDFLEHLEREGVEAVQQMLGDWLDCSNLSPETAKLVQRLCRPEHQAEIGAVAGILVAVGYILGAAVLAGPVSALSIQSMKTAGHYPIDPQLLADAHRRNRVAGDTAREAMLDSGARGLNADILFDAARQTLAPTQWLNFWQRFPQLENLADNGLSHTGLDDDSVAALKAMRLAPIGFETAVAAITQNQLTMDQFRLLMERNGYDPEWSEVVFQTAGQSPPPELAGRLYREGWIDEALFKKMLLESPLKNQYVDLLANLRFRFPPMRTTLKMLTDHVIEAPEAQTYLEKIGFFPEDARRLIESAQKHGSTSVKNLSPSVIEKLYDVGKWDRGQAIAALEALGYDATESDLLLLLVDEHKAHMQTDRAASSIGTRYVSWKIDKAEAVTLLDRLNVPAAQRDEMVEIWSARREAQTLHLSEAFLHKAWKQGAISTADVKTRLLAMGYDAVDTDIILKTDFAEVAPKAKSKDLTRADETKRYKAGIIDKATFKGRLVNAGYDATEADQIIELVDHDVAEKAATETATNGV